MKNSETKVRCQDMGSTPVSSAVYDECIDYVKTQGWDAVGAWYHGNIAPNEFYSHNPEWMVSEAQKMIYTAVNENKPFFIYFSLTLNHDPSPLDALASFSNTDSPKGQLTGSEIPSNTGMQSRDDMLLAINSLGLWNSNQKEIAAGTMWIDDAVGALINYLKSPSIDQYDNTFILFAGDHGKGSKDTLYEQ